MKDIDGHHGWRSGWRRYLRIEALGIPHDDVAGGMQRSDYLTTPHCMYYPIWKDGMYGRMECMEGWNVWKDGMYPWRIAYIIRRLTSDHENGRKAGFSFFINLTPKLYPYSHYSRLPLVCLNWSTLLDFLQSSHLLQADITPNRSVLLGRESYYILVADTYPGRELCSHIMVAHIRPGRESYILVANTYPGRELWIPI